MDFIPTVYWGGKVRPGPNWAVDLAFKFILLPATASGQAAAPALQSKDIFIYYFFKKICLLSACGDIFQAAELYGMQHCPALTSNEEP